PERLRGTKAILEMAEARLRARRFYTITANIQGSSPEAVAELVMQRPEVSGMQGPTVSKVFSRFADGEQWYAVTVVVRMADVLTAVEHMRSMGGASVTVLSPNYVFERASSAYLKLLDRLGMSGDRSADPAVSAEAP
ncbi:MAG: hypothetical protein NTZ05_19220, partial [Chloroflexi bacterium]|nr:hypothetical protein [Chloroflexota bacterium]